MFLWFQRCVKGEFSKEQDEYNQTDEGTNLRWSMRYILGPDVELIFLVIKNLPLSSSLRNKGRRNSFSLQEKVTTSGACVYEN